MTDHNPPGSDKMSTMTESDRSDPTDGAADSADVIMARSQAQMADIASKHGSSPQEGKPVVLGLRDVSVAYSGATAVRNVDMDIHKTLVTAFIGPSGCGKTTLLRSLNRMNDLIPGAEVRGKITYHGHDLNAAGVDPVEVRRRIGMVFQRPNPFPKSIFDNVAYGLRLHGMKDHLNDRVEQALRQSG